jgi:hypothetical protein
MSWLTGWDYRKEIPITGQAGSGTGYQVDLEVNSGSGSDSAGVVYLESHCENFPDDIRFTDDDGETELSHCINPVNPGTGTVRNFIINVNDDLGSNQNICIYYGKADVESASDIDSTLELGDDFTRSAETSIGNYTVPTAVELSNGDILAAARNGNDVIIRKSDDGGSNWSTLSTPFSNTGSASEPYLCLLADGTLLCATWHSTDKKLVVTKSADSGVNWGDNTPDFDDGDYITIFTQDDTDTASEPKIIELNSGNLLCSATYYNPDTPSNDIVVFKSTDDGASWGSAVTALTGTGDYHHEDSSMVQMSTGKIILAAEREYTEGAYSMLVCIFSGDEGASWGDNSPDYDDGDTVTIKDEGSDVDEEGGGLLYISDSDIRYIFTTDEDDSMIYDPSTTGHYRSYAWANIKELVTDDGGETWVNKRTIHDSMMTGTGGYNVRPLLLASGDIYIFLNDGGGTYGYWVEDIGRTLPEWQTAYNGNHIILSGGNVYIDGADTTGQITVAIDSMDTFKVEVNFSAVSSIEGKYLSVSVDVTPTTNLWQIIHRSDSRYDFRDGGTLIIDQNWSPDDDYHVLKFTKSSDDTFTNYIDGAQVGTADYPTVKQLAYLTLFFTYNPSFKVAAVSVRKYHETEPVVGTAGEEETEAGGWANIAKIAGVTATNIAKVNGIAIADIAKVNGVSV